MSKEDIKSIIENINKYRWYHRIKVVDDVYTDPIPEDDYQPLWDFILDCMKDIDFKEKRVLDVGCRDGLFSFEAERRGAKEIIGSDNDLSPGATGFLIPLFKSEVKMYELNLYELTPEKFGSFDIILLFGVLYHLRYPFWGLKKLTDVLSDKGLLLIEAGMLTYKIFENNDFLWCPYREWAPSSPTLFNKKGLCTTLCSLHCKLLDFKSMPDVIDWANLSSGKACRQFIKKFIRKSMNIIPLYVKGTPFPFHVGRQFFIFLKDTNLENIQGLDEYWNVTHIWHSLGEHCST